MIEAVRTFFNEQVINKLNELNSHKPLREVDTYLSGEIANSQKDCSYYIMLESINVADKESNTLTTANVIVRFSFLISKRENEGYRYTVDNYLVNVVRLLKTFFSSLSYEMSGFTITDVSEITVKSIGSIVENNYLKPELSFTLSVIDTLEGFEYKIENQL